MKVDKVSGGFVVLLFVGVAVIAARYFPNSTIAEFVGNVWMGLKNFAEAHNGYTPQKASEAVTGAATVLIPSAGGAAVSGSNSEITSAVDSGATTAADLFSTTGDALNKAGRDANSAFGIAN